MSEQTTLPQTEWEQMLCPFETVNKWKNGQGFSTRCPWETTQHWTKEDIDKRIKESLQTKRKVDCPCCIEDMHRFLDGKPPIPNRWLPPFLRVKR